MNKNVKYRIRTFVDWAGEEVYVIQKYIEPRFWWSPKGRWKDFCGEDSSMFFYTRREANERLVGLRALIPQPRGMADAPKAPEVFIEFTLRLNVEKWGAYTYGYIGKFTTPLFSCDNGLTRHPIDKRWDVLGYKILNPEVINGDIKPTVTTSAFPVKEVELNILDVVAEVEINAYNPSIKYRDRMISDRIGCELIETGAIVVERPYSDNQGIVRGSLRVVIPKEE